MEDSIKKHIIDCSIYPEDKHYDSIFHQKQDPLEWDIKSMGLFQINKKFSRADNGERWTMQSLINQKGLIGKRLLNVNVLDYLFENQELIPEEWKRFRIFFVGTYYHTYPYTHKYPPSEWMPTLYWFEHTKTWTKGQCCVDNTYGKDQEDYVIYLKSKRK